MTQVRVVTIIYKVIVNARYIYFELYGYIIFIIIIVV